MDTLAKARIARLSEFSKCIGDCFVESSSRRGLYVVLSEGDSPRREELT